MTNDRAAFEAFWLTRSKVRPADFERFNDDTYVMDNVQRHWWTWQQCSAHVRDAMAAAAPAPSSPEWVRDGIADFIADNWPDRKHSLEEIEAGIKAIEIRPPRPAALAEPTAEARDAARLDWLMHHLAGSALRNIGVLTHGGAAFYRNAIDKAMSTPPQEPQA